ncbi:MAG TPA: molecular chaperone Hsp90, partial [Actinomycetes bacterium]|nr:molecular chaperone Hsp90 [Actinomycetes bacterium]
MSQPPADPFDTARLRLAVLDAWWSSPTRYREDANLEEDYALGAYRDRLIVELAQNAADAARAAGVPGRLRIVLADDGMAVANTGAPLDDAGVRSLAAMRASSKDDGSVGRFGVGFAAVLSVTDAPALASRAGGVRFSRADSADLMRADPGLAKLLDDRPPPVLRLPLPYERRDLGEFDTGEFDTVVALPWRDAASAERALAAVRGIDDALFIALPDLAEVVVEGAPDDVARRWEASRDDDLLTVTVDGEQRRWRLHGTRGEWTPADLADAPTEQRARTAWSLTWAIPVTSDGSVAGWPAGEAQAVPRRVVHAPTPTDEPLALPGLLAGDFPVDASRRRLADGPMTEAVLEAAAAAYVELVQRVAQERGAQAATLVPGPDLVGPVDAELRSEIRARLRTTPWVTAADDGRLAMPSELVIVEPSDDELVRVLSQHVSDLLRPEWLTHAATLRGLGTETRPWADVWDVVAGLELNGEQWSAIFEAATRLDRSALESLPVPLADGRIVRDARRCVLSVGEQSSNDLTTLGLDVVEPATQHSLLERLGAQEFDPRRHLDVDFVRRVESLVELDPVQARELIETAVRVLAAAGAAPGELIELGITPVVTHSGNWVPAS